MLSNSEYIKQSLALHLFFARIMKEHSFFLQVGFTPKDSSYSRQADAFRLEFDKLLVDTVSLSNGVVSPMVLQSGEVFTPYTEETERASTYFTGVQIPTSITQAEYNLTAGGLIESNPKLERDVFNLNDRSIGLISAIIQFKTTVLTQVLTCKMFTVNYPLLIDHILREAKFYLEMVQRLQRKEEINKENEAKKQEAFWNNIMAEHSKFIRGLLDPTENELMSAANNFANQFDQLTNEAKRAMDMTIPIKKVTTDSLKATVAIQNFNTQGTKGLISCNIKSIIIPLLGDHVLRESNHYLRVLKTFEVSI